MELGVGLSVHVVGVLYRHPGPLHGEGAKRSGLFVCSCNTLDQPPPAGGRLTGVVNPVAIGETLPSPPSTVGIACPRTFTDLLLRKALSAEAAPVVASDLTPTTSDPFTTAPTLRGVSRSNACFGRDVRSGVQAITTGVSSDKDWSKLEFFDGLSSMMSVMSFSTWGSVLCEGCSTRFPLRASLPCSKAFTDSGEGSFFTKSFPSATGLPSLP